MVNFEQYYRPNIKRIDAGGFHSSFVDDIGRLFMCGLNDFGQLGTGSHSNELTPFYIKVSEKVHQAACGDNHTIILTLNGDVYAMGCN